MQKKFTFVGLLILAMCAACFSPANAAYKQFSAEQLRTLVPSSTRIVESLTGGWERSEDESKWERAWLPRSESHVERVVYRRALKIDRAMVHSRVWQLYFLGADYLVEVYINNQFVGRYFGGMTPFMVRIPDRMLYNSNNEIKLIALPAGGASQKAREQRLQGNRLSIGVIREVLLVGSPQAFVSDVKYNTNFSGDLNSCNVNARINISAGKLEQMKASDQVIPDSIAMDNNPNASGEFIVEATIRNKSTGIVIATSDAQGVKLDNERTLTRRFNFSATGYALWSPTNPELYELHVRLSRGGAIVDEYSQNIAFRSVAVRNVGAESKIFLNGAPFELKGVSYVEDHASTGSSVTAKRMEDDIRHIKTLGANVLRFLFAPPHPYFMSLCDKYGVFALVELPLHEIPSGFVKFDEIKVNVENSARQYIAQYDSYPSLLAYGIGEGLDERDDYNVKFMGDLAKYIKANSEKLTYKILPFGMPKVHAEGFDFIGLREVSKRLSFDDYRAELLRLRGKLPNTPVFLAFGAIVQPNNHNGYSDPLSVEYQAYRILNLYRVGKNNGAAGSIINTFNDYPLENPLLMADNEDHYSGARGLVDRYRQRRLSFATLQALFNGEKEPILNAGSYSEQTPVSFIMIGLAITIGLIFMINRFRRFREYMFRSLLRPYNFYADIRDQRIMSSVQSFILGLVVSFTCGLFLASIMYFMRNSEVAQYFYMMLLPSADLQDLLYRIVWMPEVNLALIATSCMLLQFFVAWIIRIFAFFLRAKVYFIDALTMVIWSAIPFLILLPFSIVLVRLLVITPGALVFFMILFFAVLVWSALRILRSASVVFDINPSKIYVTGVIIAIVMIGVPLGIYHIKYSIFNFAEYFFKVVF